MDYAVISRSGTGLGDSGPSYRNVRPRLMARTKEYGGIPFKPRSGGKGKAKTVRAVVKREIGLLAESKVVNYTAQPYLQGIATGSFSTIGEGIIPLSPFAGFVDIPQGTGQGARVGNYVRTKKCILSMVMSIQPYNAIYNIVPKPMMIKCWFVKFKGQSNSTASLTGFFQNGSTSSNLTGFLSDFTQEVNKEAVTLLGSKIFKIGNANISGTGNLPVNQFFANNDYPLNVLVNLDVTKYLSAKYHWQDSTTTTPTNDPTYMVIEAVNADNTQVVASSRPGLLGYTVTYHYTDF